MRLSSIILALVGLGVAAGSAQVAREMLTAPQATAAIDAANSLVNVVVAAGEIRRGDTIEPHMLRTHPWPRDAVPSGAFTDIGALLPQAGGPPRRATGTIISGEVVMGGKVSDFGARVGILQTLAADTRAMAIRVDVVTAVGGFVTPGDHVDILLTRGDREQMMTDTILRNIRVLAVDQISDERTDRPSVATTVTVEITAHQGQVLALSQRAGTLSLALRNPDTVDSEVIDGLRLRDLLPEFVNPLALAAPDAAPNASQARSARRANITIRRAVSSIEEVSVLASGRSSEAEGTAETVRED
jgi:pilus assembly protein CpaB